jgi:SAM-dependent methyltransferase
VTTIIWQEVECGSYEADLELWEELAVGVDGPVLELGCGIGRVALHLARRGHEVVGLDNDAAMVAELRDRARTEGVALRAETADAADFRLAERFGLVLAPMQVIQLLPGQQARLSCLRSVARHLQPSGLAAFALVGSAAAGVPASPPLPDVREHDGWVYSSLPLGVSANGETLVVERLRQTVGPQGHFHEDQDRVQLCTVSAAQLEEEAGRAGLNPAGQCEIAPSDAHVGSTVVLLEA